MTARLAVAIVCLALVAAGWAASRAPAAFPGQNGKIAFQSNRDGNFEIYVMNADGSAQTRLTNVPGLDVDPVWSPNGQKLVFISPRDGNQFEIYAMNPDGSAQTRLTNSPGVPEFSPTWSPDGQKIAFARSLFPSGESQIFVMNADGSGEVQLTNGSACGCEEPAWSPDGQKIAFTRGGEIFVMNADGSGETKLTDNPTNDRSPTWSPDGQKLAFQSSRDGNEEIYAMNADGSAQTNLTDDATGDGDPAWSPDGLKIVFARGSDFFVMNADGSAQTNLTNNPSFAGARPDWQPLPACPDIQVGFATAQGCFTETAPGSGIFETDQKAWVGGFEILPRPGGKLVLNPGAPGVSESGAGVDVIFAGFVVPIPLAALPVGVQDASFELGQPGTVFGVLGVPVESQVKLSWTEGGKSATYEQEIKLKELTAGIGELVTLSPNESVGAGEGKLKAKLENGKGFILESGEISISEINVIPSRLRVPRTLKLKNLLLKFEIKEQKPFWTGRAGIGLPLARGELDVTGTVFVFDGSPAGGGFEVDGINKQVLGPLFLQKAGGDLLFAPDFGMDLRIGATVGPQVAGQKLITLDGTVQGGSLVSDCADSASRPDPAKLEAKAKLPALEGIANVDITQRACIYPGTGAAAAAIEGVLAGKVDFAGGLLGYEGTQTGFISGQGASYEGSALVRLPALPDLDGSAIVSTVGLAACTDLFFFEGGFGYRFGAAAPSTFSGCDLGGFRVLQSSALLALARGGVAPSNKVPKGLPHAGFAATGTSGPPRVRVFGPGGFSVESPADGSALRSSQAVIVPVAHERTTYVFVDDPRAGKWRVESLDPANPLTEVSFAEGLPEPKVTGKVAKPARKSKGKKFRLNYELRRIAGQKVIFTERGEGTAQALGKARGTDGTISFKPTLALDRKRTIEAEVIQDGLPRELITVARFKAPPLPTLKVDELQASRKKATLKLSWAKTGGATNYLVEVKAGGEALFRVLTQKRELRFDTPRDGKLKVAVQALSETQPPDPTAKLKVKRPR